MWETAGWASIRAKISHCFPTKGLHFQSPLAHRKKKRFPLQIPSCAKEKENKQSPHDNSSKAALPSPQSCLWALWIGLLLTHFTTALMAPGGFLKEIKRLQPTPSSPFHNTGVGRANFAWCYSMCRYCVFCHRGEKTYKTWCLKTAEQVGSAWVAPWVNANTSTKCFYQFVCLYIWAVEFEILHSTEQPGEHQEHSNATGRPEMPTAHLAVRGTKLEVQQKLKSRNSPCIQPIKRKISPTVAKIRNYNIKDWFICWLQVLCLLFGCMKIRKCDLNIASVFISVCQVGVFEVRGENK